MQPKNRAGQNQIQPYQQQSNKNQNKNQKNSNQNCKKNCHDPAEGIKYVGNIFLLGLIALVAELIDLQGAGTLEYLLRPFTPDEETLGEELETDVLAAEFTGFLTQSDILGTIIPIGFE